MVEKCNQEGTPGDNQLNTLFTQRRKPEPRGSEPHSSLDPMQSEDPGLPAPQSRLYGFAGYGPGGGLVLLYNEWSSWPKNQEEGNLGGEPGPPESGVWCPWLGAIRQFPIFYLKSTVSPDYTRPGPLQCSCLENPRDGGACWAAIYGVAQSWTRLKRLSSSSTQDPVGFPRWCQW